MKFVIHHKGFGTDDGGCLTHEVPVAPALCRDVPILDEVKARLEAAFGREHVADLDWDTWTVVEE